MSQHPTSIQYRLGVQIGHALFEAVENGASYDEAIETLNYSIGLVERNRAWEHIHDNFLRTCKECFDCK